MAFKRVIIRRVGPLSWLLELMTIFLKTFFVPVFIGMFLHVAIGFFGHYLFKYISTDASTNPGTNSLFLLYLSDWFNFAYFVIPGFIAGYISKSRPALVGFVGIFLATLFVSFAFQTIWYIYPDVITLVRYLLTALPAACFGLISAIAGFSVRRNRSNYAIKGTSA